MSRRLKRAYCLLDRAPAFVGLPNVGTQEDSLATGLQYLLGHGMAALFIAAGNGNLRSFFGEEEGSGLADAGGAAGDESDFFLQTHL